MYQQKEYQRMSFVDADLAEWGRQLLESRMISLEIGGLFPKHHNLSDVHTVLDLACGLAGWMSEAAEAYPQMHFTGVDIDPVVLEYAQARSWAGGRSNVDFKIMDVTQPLPLEADSIDFIYGQNLLSFMRRADWPDLILECRRVLHPGGTLLLTERDTWVINNAPAMAQLLRYFQQALWLSEQTFCTDGLGIGVSSTISCFLGAADYELVSVQGHTIDGSYGSRAYEAMAQDTLLLVKHLQPFFERTGVARKEELEQLFHQGVEEIKRRSYQSIWYLTQTSGRKPLQ